MNTLLAQVVRVFGAAHHHHAYLITNRGGTRVKVVAHDGFRMWLNFLDFRNQVRVSARQY